MKNDSPSGEMMQVSREDFEALQKENAKLRMDLEYVTRQLDQLKRMIFSSRSERIIHPDPSQLTLGLGEIEMKEPGPAQEEHISYTRKKKEKEPKATHGRMPIPADLPRVIEEIEPPAEEIQGMKRIGKVISETLEYKEAELYVRQIIRYKYAPASGETVVIAPMPSMPIPRGNAGASLLAYLLVSKMVDGLPFYRVVQILKRHGIHLAESTINGWMAKVCRLIEPLYDLLIREVLSSGYIQSDDTTHRVLTQDKPGSSHRGYMIDYMAPHKKLLFFDYQPNRNQQVVHEMLRGYQGVLQTDGLNIYHEMDNKEGVVTLGCWAHARRKYFEQKQYDPQRTDPVLELIGQLYKVEKQAKENNLDYDKIYALRQEKSVPVLNQIYQILLEQKSDPNLLEKDPVRKAIDYTLSLWDKLKRYCENGSYLIDDNPIENSIRPLVISRKNHLFAGSHEGAKRLAIVFSFTGSCKLSGINPQEWFTDVLSRIQDTKQSELVELLPHRWSKKP
ncbi:MAG: IS66 family transposase [Bacteroidales bacterium]|nr:IS66 family transposase [Bacteroidales bacterium]